MARSAAAGSVTVAGSLTTSAPGGMTTEVRPPKVRSAAETRLMVLPPWLTATCAAPMVSGSEPNSLVKMTRTCGPPRETCTISRTVVSATPYMKAGGRPGTGAGAGADEVCAVCAGAAAANGVAGAATGTRRAGVAGRPLLAAKGAAAHVPTQWSGGGAAYEAEAMAASANSRSRREMRGCGVTGECQPRRIFSERHHLTPFEGDAGIHVIWRMLAAFTYSGDAARETDCRQPTETQ